MSPRVKKKPLPEGWMGKHSRRWLQAMAMQSHRVVEVGCWLGRSTKAMAAVTEGRIWAVDHWQGTPHDVEQHRLYADKLTELDAFAAFSRNLRKEIAKGKVIPVRMGSVEAAAYLARTERETFDFIFIDADHSYEGCKADIAAYTPLVADGGILAGHDYHWPGVKQAVDEAFGDRVTLGPRSMWSLRV